MGTNVLPSLLGLMYPAAREPVWDTIVQQNISGKEVRIAKETFPRYRYQISYSILRSAQAYTEFQTLIGFFNSLYGKFDTFLYLDPDDHTATSQQIGIGDGATTTFQLVRTQGGFIEPVLAPIVNGGPVVNIYFDGVLQSGTLFTVNPWGTSNAAGPGAVIFNSAPSDGVVITSSFQFYWPCRMSDDNLPFNLMMQQYYEVKKFAFITVKN